MMCHYKEQIYTCALVAWRLCGAWMSHAVIFFSIVTFPCQYKTISVMYVVFHTENQPRHSAVIILIIDQPSCRVKGCEYVYTIRR